MANRDESAAVQAATALFETEEETTTEETTGEAEQHGADEAAAQGAEVQEEDDLFNFEVEVPEDLLRELEEEDVTEESVTSELEQTEEYHMLDDEGKRLLARAVAAERRAEHYEKLRVQEAQKGWRAEAEKFFPAATPFLDQVDASSRKGFMREAKALHERNMVILKPLIERQKEEAKVAKETAKEEAKQEAKKAWGTGTEDPQPTEASITQEDLTRNRAKGDLASTIKSMIFPTKGG